MGWHTKARHTVVLGAEVPDKGFRLGHHQDDSRLRHDRSLQQPQLAPLPALVPSSRIELADCPRNVDEERAGQTTRAPVDRQVRDIPDLLSDRVSPPADWLVLERQTEQFTWDDMFLLMRELPTPFRASIGRRRPSVDPEPRTGART